MDLVCPKLIEVLVVSEKVQPQGLMLNFISLCTFCFLLTAPYQFPLIGDPWWIKLITAVCCTIGVFAIGLISIDRWVEHRTYRALIVLEPSRKHVAKLIEGSRLLGISDAQYLALKRYLESF
ncbi:hypothetical protein [Vibrio taketomensis]|uniref:hypothetical protein n=1 Tax=Vibrio taketomensis TaxID=2572923 RepID=UPI00138A3108|nr:hypothetical protein [Vibrio taketomensis]